MRKSHNGLGIRSKIRIEVGGEPVFGRGRRFLLEAIDSHGSSTVRRITWIEPHKYHVPDNRAGLL